MFRLALLRMLTTHILLSLHQGFFNNDKATFQQYTIVPAEIVAQVCHYRHLLAENLRKIINSRRMHRFHPI